MAGGSESAQKEAPLKAIEAEMNFRLLEELHKIQEEKGYLSEERLRELSEEMNIPLSQVWGVAKYYSGFRWCLPGKRMVKVCLGTTCYSRGSGRILRRIEQELGIASGETTQDGSASLETVYCFGACSHAPVVLSEPLSHRTSQTSELPIKK